MLLGTVLAATFIVTWSSVSELADLVQVQKIEDREELAQHSLLELAEQNIASHMHLDKGLAGGHRWGGGQGPGGAPDTGVCSAGCGGAQWAGGAAWRRSGAGGRAGSRGARPACPLCCSVPGADDGAHRSSELGAPGAGQQQQQQQRGQLRGGGSHGERCCQQQQRRRRRRRQRRAV